LPLSLREDTVTKFTTVASVMVVRSADLPAWRAEIRLPQLSLAGSALGSLDIELDGSEDIELEGSEEGALEGSDETALDASDDADEASVARAGNWNARTEKRAATESAWVFFMTGFLVKKVGFAPERHDHIQRSSTLWWRPAKNLAVSREFHENSTTYVSAVFQLRILERWPLAGLEADEGRLARSGHREGLIWGAGQAGISLSMKAFECCEMLLPGAGTSSREGPTQRGVLLRQLFVEQ
jgi:hypothetical protein